MPDGEVVLLAGAQPARAAQGGDGLVDGVVHMLRVTHLDGNVPASLRAPPLGEGGDRYDDEVVGVAVQHTAEFLEHADHEGTLPVDRDMLAQRVAVGEELLRHLRPEHDHGAGELHILVRDRTAAFDVIGVVGEAARYTAADVVDRVRGDILVFHRGGELPHLGGDIRHEGHVPLDGADLAHGDLRPVLPPPAPHMDPDVYIVPLHLEDAGGELGHLPVHQVFQPLDDGHRRDDGHHPDDHAEQCQRAAQLLGEDAGDRDGEGFAQVHRLIPA